MAMPDETVTDDLVAPVPDQTPEPSPNVNSSASEADQLDQLLAAYDSATTQEKEQRAAIEELGLEPQQDPQTIDELDKLLNQLAPDNVELTAAQQRVGELENTVAHYQQLEQQLRDGADYLEYEKMISDKIEPGSVPPDYVRSRLADAAHNPEIRAAFDLRNKREEAAQKLPMIEAVLGREQILQQRGLRSQLSPEQLAHLNQERSLCQIALNSAQTLLRVERQIVKEAREWAKHRIDESATEDRNMVAAAVRGATHDRMPEPPPDYSRLSTAEFERAKRDLFRRAG